MNCRFCSQWCARDTRKCPFCNNDPEGEADQTSAGHVQLSADQVARIPRARGSVQDEARALSKQFLGSGDDEPLPRIAVVLMVGGLLAVAIGLLIRC